MLSILQMTRLAQNGYSLAQILQVRDLGYEASPALPLWGISI